ncbi:MAG: hypothetical protein KKB38_20290 [Gammaproteobacteria bacterium]|nr:hypothetical protein [Gammaproteobacteria bacterium]
MATKTMGDVIIEHASSDSACTRDWLRLLELEDNPENFSAANLYGSALSIIHAQTNLLKMAFEICKWSVARLDRFGANNFQTPIYNVRAELDNLVKTLSQELKED